MKIFKILLMIFLLTANIQVMATSDKDGKIQKQSIANILKNSTKLLTPTELNAEYKRLITQEDLYYHSESDFNHLGYHYLEMNKPDLATATLLLNTIEFPLSVNAFDSLAEVYFSQQQMDLSEKNYLLALKLAPSYSSAWKGLAKIYANYDNDDKSFELLNNALAYSYLQGWALEKIGDLHLKNSNNNKAISYYLEAWRIQNKPDGAFNKIISLSMSDHREINSHFIADLYHLARVQAPYIFDLWKSEIAELKKLGDKDRLAAAQIDVTTKLPYRLAKKLGVSKTNLRKNAKDQGVIFTAIGCGPYSEYSERHLKSFLSKKSKMKPSQFTIHLGDIFSGIYKHSTLEDFNKVSALFNTDKNQPTFFVLGDNEWNDQENPDKALFFWKQTIAKHNLIKHSGFNLSTQKNRAENFSFIKGGVQFIGINQVGGRIQDPEEWKNRIHDNGTWIKETLNNAPKDVFAAVIFAQASADVFEQALVSDLQYAAKIFAKPILYLHADGHHWLVEHGKWAPNITRVQTDELFPHRREKNVTTSPPVTVYVNPSYELPFIFDRHTPAYKSNH